MVKFNKNIDLTLKIGLGTLGTMNIYKNTFWGDLGLCDDTILHFEASVMLPVLKLYINS